MLVTHLAVSSRKTPSLSSSANSSPPATTSTHGGELLHNDVAINPAYSYCRTESTTLLSYLAPHIVCKM